MRLRELKAEIEQSARNLFGEKAYPTTSAWIPVTDVLAIIDRFEKECRRKFETALSKVQVQSSHQEVKEMVRRMIADLLD
jgi:hypothetical protein